MFKKGEITNPNGRPKKSFRAFADFCRGEGYEPLTRGAYIEALGLILSLPESELVRVGLDQDQPLYLRLLIKQLADPAERAKAMIDYRDYCFGKATQFIDHTTDGEKINQVTVFQLPDDGRNGEK